MKMDRGRYEVSISYAADVKIIVYMFWPFWDQIWTDVRAQSHHVFVILFQLKPRIFVLKLGALYYKQKDLSIYRINSPMKLWICLNYTITLSPNKRLVHWHAFFRQTCLFGKVVAASLPIINIPIWYRFIGKNQLLSLGILW